MGPRIGMAGSDLDVSNVHAHVKHGRQRCKPRLALRAQRLSQRRVELILPQQQTRAPGRYIVWLVPLLSPFAAGSVISQII